MRAFVREASLAEDVPASVASLMANDTAQAWLAICTQGSHLDRAREDGDAAQRGLVRAPLLLTSAELVDTLPLGYAIVENPLILHALPIDVGAVDAVEVTHNAASVMATDLRVIP